MSPIKMFEIDLNFKDWGIGAYISFDDWPFFIGVTIGPLTVRLNKKQYWKNGLI